MPRGRKAKPSPHPRDENAVEAQNIAPESDPAASEVMPPSDVKQSEQVSPRGQFRSWVVDSDRGYTRMTDNQHNRIVLQFLEKPPAEVLTAIKEAGFKFTSDYHGQQNVWTRRNDFEGRVQVESIEKLFKEIVTGRDSASR